MTELSSVATGTAGSIASPTSLKPVIDVLPDSVYDNPTWRGMAYFFRDVTMYVFKSKRMNSTVAHLAFLPSFHVYEGWILGHNRVHHPYTVRQGYDFVWHPTTPEQFAALGWWRKAVHRLEWSWAGPGAYYIHQVWWKKMMVGPNPARWVNRHGLR
jgi:hypothetical protein